MIVSKQTFYKLSLYIYDQLIRWIRYNHPNKRRKWIFNRYFSKGIFVDIDKKRNKESRLYNILHVKIIRNRKLKGKFNPFVPEWEKCIEERSSISKENALKNKKKQLFCSRHKTKKIITLGYAKINNPYIMPSRMR